MNTLDNALEAARNIRPFIDKSNREEYIVALADEVERLRAKVSQLRGVLPCDGGCNENTGPEETCSLHGRPVADVWQIVYKVSTQSADDKMTLAKVWDWIDALLIERRSAVKDPT